MFMYLYELGFMYLKGHPLTSKDIETAFSAEKKFFDLPLDVKEAIPIQSGGFTRGYVGIGNESGSHLHECKEAFSYGYNWDPSKEPTNPLQGNNVFPDLTKVENSEEWVQQLNSFYQSMIDLSKTIVRILSLSLGKEETYFDSFCEEGDTISLMRFFHYFPYQRRDKVDNVEWIGSSAHTDWGFLTLLLQDNLGGLQINDPRTKEWIDVEYVEGTVLVNGGDYMSMLTQREYRSPLHRVVNKTEDKERYSIVLFYYPSYDSKIQNEDEPEIHNVKYGDYLKKKWDSVYKEGLYK